MFEAIKLIVDGYMSLKDRSALKDLRAHRQRPQETAPGSAEGAELDVVSRSTELLDEELSEATLTRFRGRRQSDINGSTLF